jgi:hypothetical protein
MPRFSQTMGQLVSAIAVVTLGAAAGSRTRNGEVKVSIVARGDVGQYAGMCGDRTGTDSLGGTLKLVSADADGSVIYEGDLSRVTQVEACGLQPNPTVDQPAWCFARLSGTVTMRVNLEVYEDDRGAWIKSRPVGPAIKQIAGCTEAGEWLNAYPNDNLLNGVGIDDVPSGPLTVGKKYGSHALSLEVLS